jgi:NMD protein affecting ribosome stability and mRNA decay
MSQLPRCSTRGCGKPVKGTGGLCDDCFSEVSHKACAAPAITVGGIVSLESPAEKRKRIRKEATSKTP